MQIEEISVPTHETVLRVRDADAGLRGFIALHSTARGPAAGGLRMRAYASEDAALADVLALSRGMTLKNAAADLPLGGGKAVILGDPAGRTEAQLRAMGRAIATLEGRYWTAEDMGMSPADMAVIREETRFVAGLPDGPFASGDPSPRTARGVFYAMRVAAERRLGSRVLEGRRVAVQGLGHVGWHLAKQLRAAGADLVVADADPARAAQAAQTFAAETVAPDAILTAPADILAPCAVGGIIDEETAHTLAASVVCGAANTQLASDAAGDILHRRGVLFVPDYIANAGGIVNVAAEILQIPDRVHFVTGKLAALEDMTGLILHRAADEGVGPHRVADRIVAARLQAAKRVA
ncbi:Glu/Leu/Phe/Val dehydrogenase dimerization domain-containing protein [Roseibacterium sp. SDUM158017]|uniref:Glu/Leu/Phe/Val family dehydrogenase n=1 Tax=Roseicyclus salinarum TaxID=3036773 RepID=UPI002415946F|nr:Glu/Leu/Phe/Val dehydrogenase dimerization domain-containing protein [Roseibacterium sp. SDUM158017]MDG4647424.1 Glu/Leu/Phe/Val dehydrogenase dimerization domain-containing protein [Roseibacterium sp. SDUM158017]